jgi:hypothetical protein
MRRICAGHDRWPTTAIRAADFDGAILFAAVRRG